MLPNQETVTHVAGLSVTHVPGLYPQNAPSSILPCFAGEDATARDGRKSLTPRRVGSGPLSRAWRGGGLGRGSVAIAARTC